LHTAQITFIEKENDMSVLQKIAFYQHQRSELPNQELARQLAQTRDQADIHEIASNLWNREPNVRSDCLKVLYELGYLAPELIAGYTDDFLKLLTDRNNRLVWGAMIALSTIASLQADKLFPYVAVIKKVMAEGSVITNDAGMKTLSSLAAHSDEYRREILPFLFERLSLARPVDAPRYAEFVLTCITPAEKAAFIAILEKWMRSAEGSRLSRLRKVLQQAGKLT
jgi:hypothetical protein